jgi:hypothetical protein
VWWGGRGIQTEPATAVETSASAVRLSVGEIWLAERGNAQFCSRLGSRANTISRRGIAGKAGRARCRTRCYPGALPYVRRTLRCGWGCGYAADAESAISCRRRMGCVPSRLARPGGVSVRAIDRGCWINLPLDTALKTKVEMPGMIGGGMSPGGCADASLYQRFHALGLKELHCFPQLVAVRPGSPRLARYQQQILAALSPAGTEAWRRAVARADCEGTYFVAQPFHCAVGTKPP